jgi:hypothetical protein
LAHAGAPALDRSQLRGDSTRRSRTGTAQEDLKEDPATSGEATADTVERVTEMPRNAYVVLLIVVLIAAVVGVDLLFFRNRFWERLTVNIGIVLVFAAFYFRFLKNP